jgi:hypothetical protein
MACRTIEIGMRERFERIIWMGYVDSEDLFDNFNFDEEIECTSTRVAYFGIARGFFAARASFWTTKATLVQTGGEDTPFLGADLCLEKCGRIWVRFRRLRRLGTFWECVRRYIEINDMIFRE